MAQPATIGTLPNIGASAPRLRYVLQNKNNAELADLSGEVVLLFCLPSLDTNTCATQTRTFSKKAVDLGAHVLVVSPDLPFAMKRFCETEGITNVHTGSDFRFRDMSEIWGAAFAEGPYQGLHCRATWVLDRMGIIRYHELAPELGSEPNYEAALNAVKVLV